MTKRITHFIFFFLVLFSNISIAAQVLKVGVGNFPPFFIEKEKTGIFIEVIDEIFKHLPQYSVEYIFMSNNRILHEINHANSIDVACNIFPGSQVKAHLSKPIFRFKDVAISRKSSKLTINNLSDLQGKSIAAYQGATALLGQEYQKIVEGNSAYSEHAHPKDTTLLLVSGKKDVRVGDLNIFWYDLTNKLYKNHKDFVPSNYNIHYLWPEVYSHMAFHDEELRNSVDEAIDKLTRDGTIEKIYAKHATNRK